MINIEKYKPSSEFMVWDRTRKILRKVASINYDIENNPNVVTLIDCVQTVEGSWVNTFLEVNKKDIVLLPYVNQRDANDEKLYLFDIGKRHTKGFKEEIYILLYFDGYFWKTLKNDNADGYDTYGIFENGFFLNRIGSVFELPDIQKEFNIKI